MVYLKYLMLQKLEKRGYIDFLEEFGKN